jgi:hypothetical protein
MVSQAGVAGGIDRIGAAEPPAAHEFEDAF